LKAYKQSVITEAVTKGLNPDAPMRDSGVVCIGEIPSHWEVKSLRFVLENLDYLRKPISAEHRERNNPIYDYYGASGVIDKIDYYNVDDKVLLIGEDGANLRMRNLPLIYKASGKFWVNNHAHILKPISDNYDYLALLLEALDYTDFITGSAQPKLSQDNLKKIRLCIPPLTEQLSIADYLDEKCANIDSLIQTKQSKIDSLKEYKKSIIYEYVTGKKEVEE
jgi:type I restriction enzyme S subunit